MSGTITNSFAQHLPGSATRDMLTQFNKIVTDLETLRKDAANCAVTAGGLAQATTTTAAKTVSTITYTALGVIKTKTATDNLFVIGVAGSNTQVAIGKSQKYYCLLDGTGAASTLEGTQAAALAAVLAPSIPDGKACVGVITVVSTTTAFTPGTTALATASGTTVAFQDGYAPQNIDLLAAQVGDVTGLAYS